MFVVWGSELGLLYNDAFAAILGDRHPAALGARLRDAWPETCDDIQPLLERVMAGEAIGQDHLLLVVNRHGGADRVGLTFSCSPARDERGQIAGTFCVVAETTGHRSAEAAHRESEARGRRVLDGMGEGFIRLDRDFRIREVNAAALRHDSRRREALIGLTCWEAHPGMDGSELGRLYKHAMAERVPFHHEHCHVRKDGRPAWFEVRAFPDGEGLAVFQRDVSERHLADDALRISEGRRAIGEESLRLSTEAAEVGIWNFDPAAELLTSSARSKAMFGISPGVACSKADFHAGLHPADKDATLAAFAAAIDPAVRATYDVEYRTLGKEDGVVRWVAAKGKGLFDERGRCVRAIGTAIDVTARKQGEARQRALADLGDRLRNAGDAACVARAAAEILGEELGVGRVGYATIDDAAATLRVEHDWTAPGVESLASAIGLQVDGWFIDGLRRGERVAIDDVRDDARTAAAAPALEGRSMRSFVNLPVLENGRLVALLYVHHALARAWRADELALIGEVADRTRTAFERQRNEESLRASEARFQAIADSINQMIWSTRPDGHYDYYNQRWYDYTGVPEGTTDGEAWNGVFHPEDQARAWTVWRHSLATGEPYHIEYRLRHRSGRYRWVLGRAQPVRDANGRIARWYGTCTDIDDMVAARDVLARSREELEHLVEARTAERNRLWSMSSLLLAVAAFDSTIREVNPAWPKVLGWSEAELVGRSYAEFLHPEDIDRSVAWAASLAGGGNVPDLENRYRCKDGSLRWIAWHITADDGVFHCIGRDITEQKEQAAALAAAEEALRQAQKMEAVGQLTGGIAHDFNNMLAVIIGSLDVLRLGLRADDARSRRCVDNATNASRRAALLTQRLLAFSRRQPLNPEALDANKLVAGMSELIRGSMGRDIRLETVLASGLWHTHADANQLENALLNLAVNGRDAMPSGGRLIIETQNTNLGARKAGGDADVPQGQYVMVTVTDTGSGMPAEVLAKAFDPFFTTKEVGKGTGLGLSQVYGFVKQSGGNVEIHSQPGQGTSVKVYLPRLLGAGAGAEAARQETTGELPDGGTQELILVVDDEPAVRQFSLDALALLGYRVLEADSAEAALHLLGQHADIALLFTHVVMPDLNGAALADQARRLRPDLKVLFTTGYARSAVVHDGVLAAGVRLIGKPFTIGQLAQKIREALDAAAVAPAG